jgi:DNA-binding CsgD family transcriptional regulator
MKDLVTTAVAHTSAAILNQSYETFAIASTKTTRMVLEGVGQAWDEQPFAELARELRVEDFMGIGTIQPDRRGCLLGVPLPRVERPSADLDRRWSKLITHVMAGFRLHEAAPHAEAILETDGRVVHAEGPAQDKMSRAALRDAARRIDRARGSMRKSDPEGALDLWRGLVSGRWSLIDHFDSDGRRYLVARQNDPEVPDPRALDRRERQVLGYAVLGASLKHIAYALGLDESSVSRARRSAMRRLGCKTLAEVFALMRAMKNG